MTNMNSLGNKYTFKKTTLELNFREWIKKKVLSSDMTRHFFIQNGGLWETEIDSVQHECLMLLNSCILRPACQLVGTDYKNGTNKNNI